VGTAPQNSATTELAANNDRMLRMDASYGDGAGMVFR
jgi:hypothetical protein